MNERAGNRFDIPGAGVLYGANPGGFAETLAGFRPKASMISVFSQIQVDPSRVGPGEVPASWLTTRRLREFEVTGSLSFVDLEATVTHTYLTREAASVLRHQELENVDVADVRGPNRLLTRAIASWLYSRTDSCPSTQLQGEHLRVQLPQRSDKWVRFDG